MKILHINILKAFGELKVRKTFHDLIKNLQNLSYTFKNIFEKRFQKLLFNILNT